ncbi:MAG: hypothetical protein AB1394_02900 [Bacteroidota bacterium]
MKLVIDGNSLTLDKIDFFLRANPIVELSTQAKKKVVAARKLVDDWVEKEKPFMVLQPVLEGFQVFEYQNTI